MSSSGVHPETGETVDELARIMVNFHNEVENVNPLTKEVFSNQTLVWSTSEYSSLSR